MEGHLECWSQFENSPWSILVFFYFQLATLEQIPPLMKALLAAYFFSFLVTLVQTAIFFLVTLAQAAISFLDLVIPAMQTGATESFHFELEMRFDLNQIPMEALIHYLVIVEKTNFEMALDFRTCVFFLFYLAFLLSKNIYQ